MKIITDAIAVLSKQVESYVQAVRALRHLERFAEANSPSRAKTNQPKPRTNKKHRMTANGREAIAQAQKERWAKWRERRDK